MRNLVHAAVFFALSIGLSTKAEAVVTSYLSISYFAQQGDYAALITPSSTPSGTGCANPGTLYLPTTNGAYPTYKSLAPLLLAAFLYNKPVSFVLTGCDSGTGYPIIVGAWLQN